MTEHSSTGPGESVRIDQWAWSVRLYKTRPLAAAACKRGRLLVNGQRCRASRRVRPGDEIRMRQGMLERILLVKTSLRHRVGPKSVAEHLLDLTPPEEYARVAELERTARESTPLRDSGAGRPTKRERRELEEWSAEGPEPSFEDFAKAFRRHPPK